MGSEATVEVPLPLVVEVPLLLGVRVPYFVVRVPLLLVF